MPICRENQVFSESLRRSLYERPTASELKSDSTTSEDSFLAAQRNEEHDFQALLAPVSVSHIIVSNSAGHSH